MGKKKNRRIRKTDIDKKKTKFSFKYLQINHSKFHIDKIDIIYWQALIERLKNLSTLTPLELRQNTSKALRCHKIDWQKTSEKEGFRLSDKQLATVRPYQFSVSSNEHGRVHGFFIDNIFYIVWLDPKHQLYP